MSALDSQTPALVVRPPTADPTRLSEIIAHGIRYFHDPARALVALAHLDPARAAAWMEAEEELVRGELRGIAGEAIRAGLVGLARDGEPGVAKLLRRYADLVSVDTLLELAPDLRALGLSAELAGALARHTGPDAVDDGALRLAIELRDELGDPAGATRLESALGRASPTMATMRWLARRRAGRSAGAEVRIALLGSFTLDPLPWFLDFEIRELGLTPRVWTGAYNGWEREIADPASPLLAFDPELVVVCPALDDLVPQLDGQVEPGELERLGNEALERVAGAVERLAARSSALVIAHTFHSAHPDPAGVAAAAGGRSRWIARLTERFAARLEPLPQVRLLDLRDLLVRRAGGGPDDAKLRHLARMRYTDAVSGELAAAYAGYVAPLKGLSRKCVVLDLDNTLWGGVVGEDGVNGIRLGTTAPGSEFVEFQRFLRGLSGRGILLAVASKNNPHDALAAIRGHESMVLREEDFAATRINWLPKADNLRSIAEELGIGLDSLVFLDDNPVERALMREMLPQVLTPELPRDPARYREVVSRIPQLQILTITDEDRARAARYRVRALRERGRERATSLEEYLHTLEIHVRTGLADASTLPRVHQLFQRTNQFNLTGRRYTLPELEALASSPDWRIYVTKAGDRFGEHGYVGAALLRSEGRAWSIEGMVLSCRVIGYGVETALLSRPVRDALTAGAERVEGSFVPTPRNHPAADFYPRHDFERVSTTPEESVWRRSAAAGPLRPPAWLRIDDD